MNESATGTLLVLAAAAGFGTIGIFGELAAAADLELSTLLLVRFSLATFVLLGVGALRDWPLPRSPGDRLATLALGVVYAAMTLLYFVSLRFLTAGLATVLLYTYPAFVFVVAAVVLRESVTARKGLALVVAIGGVAVVVGTDTAGADPAGVVLALGAALCYALYTTGSRAVVSSIPPRSLMVGVLVGTTLCTAGYGFATGVSVPVGRAQWGIVLGLALVGTVVPHLLFYEGVARLEAGLVGVLTTVEPLVTVVLGAVLLDEPVTAGLLAGGGLVAAGVVLARRDAGQSRSSAPARTGTAD